MARSANARNLDYPAFQGRGWRFGDGQDVARKSVTLDKRWGRVEMVAGEEDIGQSIGIIIGTARGERLMRPDFGCGIHELVFEPISSALVQEVKATVREALTEFEARIELNEVSVSTRNAINGFLEIAVAYRVRTTNQVGNFVYPYYFREST